MLEALLIDKPESILLRNTVHHKIKLSLHYGALDALEMTLRTLPEEQELLVELLPLGRAEVRIIWTI